MAAAPEVIEALSRIQKAIADIEIGDDGLLNLNDLNVALDKAVQDAKDEEV